MKQKSQEAALKEVMILQDLSHPHIIKYYHSFIEQDCLYILMEYAQGGDLHSLMRKRRSKNKMFSEHQIWRWAYEICLGVRYLHEKSILHRDIKSLNIFLTKTNRVKIGDLGISKIFSGSVKYQATKIGTPLYLSPEQVKQKPYDLKVDIWGIGWWLYHITNEN